MDVERMQDRHVEHNLGQDQPVGRHHQHVRLERAQRLDVLFILEILRLEHGQSRARRPQPLTGEGLHCLPRPHGRSGWVYTPTTSAPWNSSRMRRISAANSACP